MANTVRVVIWADMRATYRQTVDMPESDYKRLDKLLSSDDCYERWEAEEEIRDWLDFMDIHDMDEFELGTFEVKVDKP